jgi:hypothetical protein
MEEFKVVATLIHFVLAATFLSYGIMIMRNFKIKFLDGKPTLPDKMYVVERGDGYFVSIDQNSWVVGVRGEMKG